MKETYRMYYDAPYKQEFDAHIEQGVETGRGFEAVLDRTLFYPGGGGQPPDTGTLEGIRVLGVEKNDDGTIVHVLESAPSRRVLHGVIDWSRRFDFMQQHTGQHILSSALLDAGGFNTVSVHFGDYEITIETDAPETPRRKLLEAEDLANGIICENLPVSTLWITEEEIPSYPFRRPPAVGDRIRVVRIGEFDCAACGGIHVESTGEVRLVHLIGTEKIRGRIRSAWKIGNRAILDYRMKTEITASLSALLSSPAKELEANVRALRDAAKRAQNEAAAAHAARAALESGRLLNEGTPVAGFRLIAVSYEDEHPAFLKKLGEELSSVSDCVALVLNVSGEALSWIIRIPHDAPLSWDEMRTSLLPMIEGKGGGKPPIFQGSGRSGAGTPSGPGTDPVRDFSASFREYVTGRLEQGG